MEDKRINISDRFEKSKKNLLWISATILFIFIAKLQDPIKIKFAEVEFSIDRDHLILFVSLYFAYLLFIYIHELYFAYRLNSDAGRTLEELNAKDFVKNSIKEISNSVDALKQNVQQIKNLESILPNNEPISVESVDFSYSSLDSLRNTMSILSSDVQQDIQNITNKIIESHGMNDDILEFKNSATHRFYLAAQNVVDRFLTVRLEYVKNQNAQEIEAAKIRFSEKMEQLNFKLKIVQEKIENNSILIEKTAESFLGISNSVHKISKFSFVILDGITPLVLSSLSVAALVMYYFEFI